MTSHEIQALTRRSEHLSLFAILNVVVSVPSGNARNTERISSLVIRFVLFFGILFLIIPDQDNLHLFLDVLVFTQAANPFRDW